MTRKLADHKDLCEAIIPKDFGVGGLYIFYLDTFGCLKLIVRAVCPHFPSNGVSDDLFCIAKL